MESTKDMAKKYYETSYTLRKLMDDATKKQRVEDWDQILFVKKNDAQEEERNRRNARVPEDKQMDEDGGEECNVFDLIRKSVGGDDVESLYHQANAIGQDHRGYRSFTFDWSTIEPGPMPVDDKNPFGGVGGSTFDGSSTPQLMEL